LGVVTVLLHTLVIATWVGPSTPVRTAVDDDRLRSYVLPVFEQSWMIFAPTPRRVAVNLQIRFEYVDPASDEPVITDWVDLVDGEDALIAGNPFPPRMSLAARRVANTLNAAMGDLNDAQLAAVAGNDLATPSVLGDRIRDVTDAGVPSDTIGTYLEHDEIATHLATPYFAAPYPERELLHVQVRTGVRHGWPSRPATT